MAAEGAIGPSRAPIPIFDGQTLKGWSQFENSTISFSPNSILDPVELGKRLQDRTNPTSVFLYSLLSDAVKQQMAADQSGDADHKALSSALAKYFNEQVAARSLDAPGRFDLKAIRPETREPLAKNPRGVELMRLNKLLIESAIRRNWRRAYPKGGSAGTAPWRALEADVESSTARGTMRDFGSSSPCATSPASRITKPCVVIFCTRPQPDEKPLDALGGIQFQVPNGATDFHDPNAGKIGPIALQMHNAGLSMSTKISLSKSIPRMTNSSAQSCRLARKAGLVNTRSELANTLSAASVNTVPCRCSAELPSRKFKPIAAASIKPQRNTTIPPDGS